MKKIITSGFILLVALTGISFSGKSDAREPAKPAAAAADSLDIKIGQMIMVGIGTKSALAENDTLLSEISSGLTGGIILFEKNISKSDSKNALKKLIASMQAKAGITLFMAIDEEGGKVHRLKEKYGFIGMPSAAYLGKLDNVDSTLAYNRNLAKELTELGFNYNFAPVLDLATNPNNTIIAKKERSFSADPAVVTKHALCCIQAHHENKVKTILKHFPGHGSSTGDTHKGIVDVESTWQFSELIPYYSILQSGKCDAIMTAHLVNARWDSTQLPATLSRPVITGMLRGLLNYKGVIFSDDMQMHAISKNYGFEKAIGLAINAGVDVLIFGNNVDPGEKPVTATQVHAIIKKLVTEKIISEKRIDESYRRIIQLKNKS